MAKRYTAERLMNNLKLTASAERLGVSLPMLSAWESERKSPSIASLENMVNLYGVTTDYLLGRTENDAPDPKQPIPKQIWMIYDGNRYGLRRMACCSSMRQNSNWYSQMDELFHFQMQMSSFLLRRSCRTIVSKGTAALQTGTVPIYGCLG